MHQRPEPHEIDAAFNIISESSGKAIRQLNALLYSSAKKWHDVRDPSTGNTLLLEAIGQGDKAITSVLLNKGFDPLVWNNDLYTGLHLTEDFGIAYNLMRFSRCQMALEQNIDGDIPLHIHLRNGNEKIVEMLLDAPNASAQMLRKNKSEETSLFNAARNHPQAVLKMLLLGADPRIKNKNGESVIDVCNDDDALAKLKAYSAQFDRYDEARRENLAAEIVSDAKISLANKAKQFLNVQTFDAEAVSDTKHQSYIAPSP